VSSVGSFFFYISSSLLRADVTMFVR